MSLALDAWHLEFLYITKTAKNQASELPTYRHDRTAKNCWTAILTNIADLKQTELKQHT